MRPLPELTLILLQAFENTLSKETFKLIDRKTFSLLLDLYQMSWVELLKNTVTVQQHRPGLVERTLISLQASENTLSN